MTPYDHMRHSILQTASAGIKRSPFNNAYLFSWSAGVYPMLDTTLDMHKPYDQFFTVTGEQIHELASFLEQIWLKGETVTFWTLEELFEAHFILEWDRQKLIDGCRYLRLGNLCDDSFWQAMIQKATPDSEQQFITRPFIEDELLLIFA